MPNMAQLVISDDTPATIATLAPRYLRDQVGFFDDITNTTRRASVTCVQKVQGNGANRAVIKIVQPCASAEALAPDEDIIMELTCRVPSGITTPDVKTAAVRELMRGILDDAFVISLIDDREGVF